MDKLSSTQIGAIAENHVANMLMITTDGRLSAFQPVADDDGIDLLIYDKRSGRALPAQVKCRTVTINRSGTTERSDTVHFELRSFSSISRVTVLSCSGVVTAPSVSPLFLNPKKQGERVQLSS